MFGVSIVLYQNDPAPVLATVRAAAAQGLPGTTIRVHVNADTAEDPFTALMPAVQDAAPFVPVVFTSSPENRGFAAAHNQLLAAHFDAGCTGVLVLNPDLVLERDALRLIAAAADERTVPALFGPVLELADPSTMVGTGCVDSLGIVWTRSGRHLDDRQGTPMPDPLPTRPYLVAGISGACLYVTRATHDVVTHASGEFFDEDFVAYREDAELGLRAAMLGVPCFIVPAARGRHVRRLRGTGRRLDPFIDRLGVRNRFLLAFKYGLGRPGWAPLVLMRDFIVLLGVIVRERSSWPGVADAWRLRHAMRAKGARIRAAAALRK